MLMKRGPMTANSTPPEICAYCDGTGRSSAAVEGQNECGFCDQGTPLDTQEDWDRTWGRALAGEPE